MEGVLARDVEQLIPAGPLTKQPERERERERERKKYIATCTKKFAVETTLKPSNITDAGVCIACSRSLS
jgi:hypothetical protein